VGAIIAVPVVGSGALALFVYALVTVLARRRTARRERGPIGVVVAAPA
jgi:hypothetical protein